MGPVQQLALMLDFARRKDEDCSPRAARMAFRSGGAAIVPVQVEESFY